MKLSLRTGLCFGLTSATITTLGLMVGLHSFTGSKLIIIGAILTIAIADAFSDALGIHISEEFKNTNTPKEIWEATIATFLTKFFFALTFIAPIALFDLSTSIVVSIGWGLFILSVLSYVIAREKREERWKVIGEHVIIALIVIAITHSVSDLIAEIFG